MRLQSLISMAFKERQYRCAYLKQMHELLKDCSEITLTVKVDHTPPVSVQPWKIQKEWRKWTNSPECYPEQRNQTQKVVSTQIDQISPNTPRRCDYCVHSACIAGILSQRHSVWFHTSHVHLQQIHVLSSKIAAMTTPRPCPETMTDCSMEDAEQTSAPIDTHITLEKVAFNVGILSPPRIWSRTRDRSVRLKPDRNFDTTRS